MITNYEIRSGSGEETIPLINRLETDQLKHVRGGSEKMNEK